MSTFTLPDLGEGLQQAEIVSWHVAEGDHVTADEPLVSVETDKAVVDIPSPRSGRIAHLLAKAGESVKVHAPLVEFEEGPHADTGTVMGVLPEHETKPAAAPPPAPVVQRPTTDGGAQRVAAAPAARTLAHERGIDLGTLRGTGPGGLITRADVERLGGPQGPPQAAASVAGGGEPLRGMRRAMAESMSRARDTICPATLWDHADVEAWIASDRDVTSHLIRAIVAACATVPVLNAWFDDQAMTVQRHARVDLGMAVDTPDGLIVPVLRDVGSRGADALRSDVNTLKEGARARSLPPGDLRNPTITLSNFGMLAGEHAALVIVPPQVAIVGAGRITLEAVPAAGGGVAFRHRLPLSLTFDHRVVTGGDAARFMSAMIASMERGL